MVCIFIILFLNFYIASLGTGFLLWPRPRFQEASPSLAAVIPAEEPMQLRGGQLSPDGTSGICVSDSTAVPGKRDSRLGLS